MTNELKQFHLAAQKRLAHVAEALPPLLDQLDELKGTLGFREADRERKQILQGFLEACRMDAQEVAHWQQCRDRARTIAREERTIAKSRELTTPCRDLLEQIATELEERISALVDFKDGSAIAAAEAEERAAAAAKLERPQA